MNGITLQKYPRDYKLIEAYKLYEQLHAAFKNHFRRAPEAGIFVGTQGEKDTQVSSVTVRWENTDGKADAQALQRYYTNGAF